MKESVKEIMDNIDRVELFHYLMNLVREVSDKEAEMMYKQMHEENQKIIEEKDSLLNEKDSRILEEQKQRKALEALLLQRGMSEEDINEYYKKMSLS